MITIKELKKILVMANDSSQLSGVRTKQKFLENIRAALFDKTTNDPSLDRILNNTRSWLAGDLSRWPLKQSQLKVNDIDSYLSGQHWNKLRSAVSVFSDIVWEAITVKYGNCDVCGTGDLVYVWSPILSEVILSCDFCSNCFTSDGVTKRSVGNVIPVTTTQLNNFSRDSK